MFLFLLLILLKFFQFSDVHYHLILELFVLVFLLPVEESVDITILNSQFHTALFRLQKILFSFFEVLQLSEALFFILAMSKKILKLVVIFIVN